MSFIPTVTCRRCGHKYSAIHRRCPNCGTRRVGQSGRIPAGTPSVVKGTAANGRAAVDAKWQLIFGAILVLAILIAVIVLVTSSVGGGSNATPSTSITPVETTSPSPTPTPTPTPTVSVDSISVYYSDTQLTEFAVKIGGTATPVTARVYPLNVKADVEWSVGDDSIISIEVDDDGTCHVSGVGSGSTKLIASCGDKSVEVTVYSN